MHLDSENLPHGSDDEVTERPGSVGRGWQALGGLALGLCLLVATVFATNSWSSCEPPERTVRSSAPSDSPQTRQHVVQISAQIDHALSPPPTEPDAALEGSLPESDEDSGHATRQPNPLD